MNVEVYNYEGRLMYTAQGVQIHSNNGYFTLSKNHSTLAHFSLNRVWYKVV